MAKTVNYEDIPSKEDKPSLARITLVVEYEDMPSDEYLEELIACARGEGAVRKAELVVITPFTRDLRSL